MSDEHDEGECIPQDAVILRELHIVEFMDAEGEIYKVDFSNDGSGQELPLGSMLELSEWAKAAAVAPMIASMVIGFTQSLEDE